MFQIDPTEMTYCVLKKNLSPLVVLEPWLKKNQKNPKRTKKGLEKQHCVIKKAEITFCQVQNIETWMRINEPAFLTLPPASHGFPHMPLTWTNPRAYLPLGARARSCAQEPPPAPPDAPLQEPGSLYNAAARARRSPFKGCAHVQRLRGRRGD